MTRPMKMTMSERLIIALNEKGLDAHTMALEGGPEGVVVPLFDAASTSEMVEGRNPEVTGYMHQTADNWQQKGYLYITTRGQDFPTEVGVMGLNGETGERYESDTWEQVTSVEEATAAFQNFWDNRDTMFSGLTGPAA